MNKNDMSDAGDEGVYVIYTGHEGRGIPNDVIRVKVHPSVKRIEEYAFTKCLRMAIVILGVGVEKIGAGAFNDCTRLMHVNLADCYVLEEIEYKLFCGCTSLSKIAIPPAVRRIKDQAFEGCRLLAIADLGEGRLEVIGAGAFHRCTSLREIIIPPSVRVIKKLAFGSCSELATVALGEGLEEIGRWAFRQCTSLREIVIPRSVREIDETAFEQCSELTNVQFCNEIEEFVSGESMRDWWNHGLNVMCMSTYNFIVRCNIPTRVGFIQPRVWQTNIYDMLRRIPSVFLDDYEAYFDSIHSKLLEYEHLEKSPMLLELAIWKVKIAEQTDGNNVLVLAADTKEQCRTDSLTMVSIVVPKVLSFL